MEVIDLLDQYGFDVTKLHQMNDEDKQKLFTILALLEKAQDYDLLKEVSSLNDLVTLYDQNFSEDQNDDGDGDDQTQIKHKDDGTSSYKTARSTKTSKRSSPHDRLQTYLKNTKLYETRQNKLSWCPLSDEYLNDHYEHHHLQYAKKENGWVIQPKPSKVIERYVYEHYLSRIAVAKSALCSRSFSGDVEGGTLPPSPECISGRKYDPDFGKNKYAGKSGLKLKEPSGFLTAWSKGNKKDPKTGQKLTCPTPRKTKTKIIWSCQEAGAWGNAAKSSTNLAGEYKNIDPAISFSSRHYEDKVENDKFNLEVRGSYIQQRFYRSGKVGKVMVAYFIDEKNDDVDFYPINFRWDDVSINDPFVKSVEKLKHNLNNYASSKYEQMRAMLRPCFEIPYEEVRIPSKNETTKHKTKVKKVNKKSKKCKKSKKQNKKEQLNRLKKKKKSKLSEEELKDLKNLEKERKRGKI